MIIRILNFTVLLCISYHLCDNSGSGPLKAIVDMKTFMKVRGSVLDCNRQLMKAVEELSDFNRTVLVALCLSVADGGGFFLLDACNMCNTYCSLLNAPSLNGMQVEQALNHLLQNGIIEVSDKGSLGKLGRGCRPSDFKKVCGNIQYHMEM